MNLFFNQSNKNILSHWWWTIDKILLSSVIFLIVCGFVLSFSASPAVAERINKTTYFFVWRHNIYLCIAFFVMLFFSIQNLKWTRRLALLGYISVIFLLVIILFFGYETKAPDVG